MPKELKGEPKIEPTGEPDFGFKTPEEMRHHIMMVALQNIVSRLDHISEQLDAVTTNGHMGEGIKAYTSDA